MISKSENAEIAVLQNQMETLKADVKEIGHDTKNIIRSLDKLPQSFVTKEDFEDYRRGVNKRFKRRWIENTLSATAGVIITALIVFFITHQTSL